MKNKKTIWITWQKHRRTQELAKRLNIKLFELLCKGNRFKRYIVLLFKTFTLLCKERPHTLFVQSPSVILAVYVVILKVIFRYKLIIDAHNAGVYCDSKTFYIPNFIYKFSHKYADLIIVTNRLLKERVEVNGGKAFVLPDVLPKFDNLKKINLKGSFNIVFICTFADDEPYRAVISAMENLFNTNQDIYMYITGKLEKIPQDLKNKHFKNLTFTGFLSDEDYLNLLYSSDAIIDLTDREDCLVCGAYEAVALEKPMILSDSVVSRELFSCGVVYTENEIENAILEIFNDSKILKEQIRQLKEQMAKLESEKIKQIKCEFY